ncbi:hypothetical protein DH09_02135 [Bacillaceae bacterium JMAK1]|nr:hypothetical protein DH09_02135 [Bacillaceae bacterium JMAK1]
MSNSKATIDYEKVVSDSKFKALMNAKKRFIVPMTIFFFLFYFTLPVLASYTTILHNEAFGVITWAWVLAVAQFVMTWTLCIMYTRKANQYDRMADEVLEEHVQIDRREVS